jgi:hypothetical protein
MKLTNSLFKNVPIFPAVPAELIVDDKLTNDNKKDNKKVVFNV